MSFFTQKLFLDRSTKKRTWILPRKFILGSLLFMDVVFLIFLWGKVYSGPFSNQSEMSRNGSNNTLANPLHFLIKTPFINFLKCTSTFDKGGTKKESNGHLISGRYQKHFLGIKLLSQWFDNRIKTKVSDSY